MAGEPKYLHGVHYEVSICPYCKSGKLQKVVQIGHMNIHMWDGFYTCLNCNITFGQNMLRMLATGEQPSGK